MDGDSATEKLTLGLQRLAKAGDDADLLGLALQSIHGALEDHFRAKLAADQHLPPDQRAAVLDPKKVQWKDLLDAMQLYCDLSQPDRELIWRTNGMRVRVAHGGRYGGTRAELERYAALVQSLCGYTAPAKPARAPRQPATPDPTGRRPARPPAAPDAPNIPRAVRQRPAPAAAARSRMGWLAVMLALALLVGLAGFVVLRSAAQSRAQRAEAQAEPTADATPDPAGALAQPSDATAAPPRSAVVAASEGLNLRRDHALSAGLIATLSDGATVTVVGGPVQAGGFTWWNVEFNGQRGWCVGDFLRFDSR
ncbi:MAG: SH3 domain-containing protein [Kouleothrix sp.]|nr:SH3 domain-containing protein [Kouleothrix sp.]